MHSRRPYKIFISSVILNFWFDQSAACKKLCVVCWWGQCVLVLATPLANINRSSSIGRDTEIRESITIDHARRQRS